MKVICYGDSNTYGFDPRGWLGERYSADDRWADILAGLTVEHDKILLIAPPPVAFGTWVQEQRLIDASAELAVQYQALAERLGVRFADTGVWGVGLAYDGVHFTEQGHRAFAEGIWKELTVSPAAPENTSPNTPC